MNKELEQLKTVIEAYAENGCPVILMPVAKHLLSIAERLKRQRNEAVKACKLAVYEESELPGEMPDEMWEAIKNDRDAVMHALRLAVRQTKEGIISRIDSMNHGQVEQ